jgi:hypothetical protein
MPAAIVAAGIAADIFCRPNSQAIEESCRSYSSNPCVTEVDNYLEDPSSELSSLFKYPNIFKLYVKLNTGLPASAAVERLFSLGGRVFSQHDQRALRNACFNARVRTWLIDL